MSESEKRKLRPGECVSWEEKRKEFPQISGDEALIKQQWENLDSLGYVYAWQCLLSF